MERYGFLVFNARPGLCPFDPEPCLGARGLDFGTGDTEMPQVPIHPVSDLARAGFGDFETIHSIA
jgi:hypothetical protein